MVCFRPLLPRVASILVAACAVMVVVSPLRSAYDTTFIDISMPQVPSSVQSLHSVVEIHPTYTYESMLPLSNRENCNEIRGTQYISEDERNWFLENCIERLPNNGRVDSRNSSSIEPSISHDIICSYDWPCREAIEVWYCESSGDWGAYNQGNYGGFQINEIHHAKVSGVLRNLFDPYVNTQVAYQLWTDQGWQPWTCKPLN